MVEDVAAVAGGGAASRQFVSVLEHRPAFFLSFDLVFFLTLHDHGMSSVICLVLPIWRGEKKKQSLASGSYSQSISTANFMWILANTLTKKIYSRGHQSHILEAFFAICVAELNTVSCTAHFHAAFRVAVI